MKLSEHFTLEEATFSDTAVRKGLKNNPGMLAVQNMGRAAAQLEIIRSALGRPIIVNSWYRSEEVNAAIGGAGTSAHCQGWAIDFKVPEMTVYKVCLLVSKMDILFDQLIFEYDSWCHISFDPKYRGQILTKRSGPYQNGLTK